MDPQGRSRELHVQGFVARVIQHEVDHLNGILFIDRMSPVKRIALAGRLKKMRKETQASLV
jgi:peptide deformylase